MADHCMPTGSTEPPLAAVWANALNRDAQGNDIYHDTHSDQVPPQYIDVNID